jgi:DNA-binding response OmpR family regulator
MSKTRILVIEDEDNLRMALCDALRAADYEVLEAADGELGLTLALRDAPDMILLDLMLPKRDGLSVLKALREDRVQGFEYGADDYLVKPFSMRELLLRIRAARQRATGQAPGISDAPRSTRFGQVEVDFAAYSLLNAGVRHGLSRRELELLRYFIANEGRTLDRLTILDAVWGQDESPTTRTVDMHVLKLRKKLEPDPEQPVHLLTVHGVGYRFLRRP